MRTTPRSLRILFLPLCLGLAGCASTSAVRSGGEPKIRTVASIGDRPLPVVSGTPGSSVVAEKVTPQLRVGGRGRVSGRVVDAEGNPVPNASVRLAMSGTGGGRITRATTDRSGGFTLHGLRPGTAYTVIAELDDPQGRQTGRSDVKAPETDVRITLGSSAEEKPSRGASRVSTISDHTAQAEEEGEEEATPSRVNREDLIPGPDEPLSSSEIGDDGVAPRSSSPRGGSGWRPGESVGETRHELGRRPDDHPSEPTEDPEMMGTGGVPPSASFDDDGENPLPPALEREPAAGVPPAEEVSRAERPPVEEQVAVPAPVEEPAPPRTAGTPRRRRARPAPEPEIAPERKPGALVVSPMTPETRTREDEPAAVAEALEEETRVSTAKRRPTWKEVTAQADVPPVLEEKGVRTVSAERALPNTEEAPRPGPALAARPRTGLRPNGRLAKKGEVEGAETVETFCKYDAKNRTIEDFRLPDLDGKPVRLRDLDADLVLIDFWGTWCAPCLEAIPHLVELQERLGPGRLKVVGIACEKGDGDRAAKVARAVEELGINYQVLLSSTEGPCPLQEALHIQAYPTMILVDRKGQILWRDQGATEMTLARLDRVIASAANASEPGVVRR